MIYSLILKQGQHAWPAEDVRAHARVQKNILARQRKSVRANFSSMWIHLKPSISHGQKTGTGGTPTDTCICQSGLCAQKSKKTLLFFSSFYIYLYY